MIFVYLDVQLSKMIHCFVMTFVQYNLPSVDRVNWPYNFIIRPKTTLTLLTVKLAAITDINITASYVTGLIERIRKHNRARRKYVIS